MKMSLEAKEEGLSIRPVVAPRPIGLLLGLKGSQNPFSGTDTFKKLKNLSHDERAVSYTHLTLPTILLV